LHALLLMLMIKNRAKNPLNKESLQFLFVRSINRLIIIINKSKISDQSIDLFLISLIFFNILLGFSMIKSIILSFYGNLKQIISQFNSYKYSLFWKNYSYYPLVSIFLLHNFIINGLFQLTTINHISKWQTIASKFILFAENYQEPHFRHKFYFDLSSIFNIYVPYHHCKASLLFRNFNSVAIYKTDRHTWMSNFFA